MQSERWCLGDGDDDEDDDDIARHMDQMYLFKTEEKKNPNKKKTFIDGFAEL